MAGLYKKEDLRVLKTHKAIRNGLLTLLYNRTFKKITVNDLCEQSLVSRAAFYSHYIDKYDLLRKILSDKRRELIENHNLYKSDLFIASFNKLIYENAIIITNIISDADSATLSIMIDIINPLITLDDNLYLNTMQQNLMTFCAGGIIQLIIERINNGLPISENLLDENLLKIIKIIMDLNKE